MSSAGVKSRELRKCGWRKQSGMAKVLTWHYFEISQSESARRIIRSLFRRRLYSFEGVLPSIVDFKGSGSRLNDYQMLQTEAVDSTSGRRGRRGLAQKRFGRLSIAEQRFFQAVGSRQPADYSAKQEQDNDPANAGKWENDRVLKADRIVNLIEQLWKHLKCSRMANFYSIVSAVLNCT